MVYFAMGSELKAVEEACREASRTVEPLNDLNDLNVLNGLRQVEFYFPDQTRLKKPLLSISSR